MADKNIFYCTNCGNDFSKWVGQCPSCKNWNTLVEYKVPKASKGTSHKDLVDLVKPIDLRSSSSEIIPTNISEFDRVLGGGLTPGGVYLISGQPGIGKSTLLSLLSLTHSQNHPVYYVCAEENPSQVTNRLYRLDPDNKSIDQISLLGTNALSDILHHLSKATERSLLIVDSIQTIETDSAPGQAGTPSQIRACSSEIIKLTKKQKIITLIVGHVTKSGVLAGPKLLEHMVDVVLELEGDRHYDLRLLRGIKNRFGATDETGLFQMNGSGLKSVDDPNSITQNDLTRDLPGSTVCMIMEGTRPITLEVQALVVPTELAIPRRIAQGISPMRLQLICAVLTKHRHVSLGQFDVFVNVTSGINIKEPAADLAIALAIVTSVKNKPLKPNSIVFGELGLLGEIRPVNFADKRTKQAKSLGYTSFYTPEQFKHIKEIKI